jgi:hypothetical protein
MSFDETSIGILVCLEQRYAFIKDFIQSLSLASNKKTDLYLIDTDISSDVDDNIIDLMGNIEIEETEEGFILTKGIFNNIKLILIKMCDNKKNAVKNYIMYTYLNKYDICGFFEPNVIFYPDFLKKASSILNNGSYIVGSCYSNNEELSKNGYKFTNYKKSFSSDEESNECNFFTNRLVIESIKPYNLFQKERTPLSIIGDNFLCHRFTEKLYLVKQ